MGKKRGRWKAVPIVIEKYTIFFIIVIFFFLYCFIAITKYEHFQTGLDLAIYVQTFWYYTHLKLPYVTLYPTFGDLVWSDHFSPSLMILTPLYAFFKDPRALLIFQTLFFVSGSYAIYLFAKEQLRHTFFALAVVINHLLAFATQYPLTFDFHVGTFAASFLPWIFFATFKKRWKLVFFLALISMGGKEDMPVYIAVLSLYLILTRRNWKLGALLLPISICYFLLVTEYLMPKLSNFGAKTFSVSYVTLNPITVFTLIFSSPVKIFTMFTTFYQNLFLLLFSGPFLLFALTHFLINFANTKFPGRWGLYLHYRGYLSFIMAFGSILGYVWLSKWRPSIFNTNRAKTVFAILLIANALLLDGLYHLPINTFTKHQFYFKESWISDNNAVIKKIPENAYLVTTNNLAPQTAFREKIHYFPHHINETQYILADLHPGQPPVNTWLTPEFNQYRKDIQALVKSKKFQIVARSHDTYLLKRNQNVR